MKKLLISALLILSAPLTLLTKDGSNYIQVTGPYSDICHCKHNSNKKGSYLDCSCSHKKKKPFKQNEKDVFFANIALKNLKTIQIKDNNGSPLEAVYVYVDGETLKSDSNGTALNSQ